MKSCVMFFLADFFLLLFLIKTVFNYHHNTCFGNPCKQLCPKDYRKCYLDILKWM